MKRLIYTIILLIFVTKLSYALNYWEEIKRIEKVSGEKAMAEYIQSLPPEKQLLAVRQMCEAVSNDQASGTSMLLYFYPKSKENLQLIINDIKNQKLHEEYRSVLLWIISTENWIKNLDMKLLEELQEYLLKQINNEDLSNEIRRMYIKKMGHLIIFFDSDNTHFKNEILLKKIANKTIDNLIELKNKTSTSHIIKLQICFVLIEFSKQNLITKSREDIHLIIKTDFLNEKSDEDYKKKLAERLFVNFGDYETVERELPNFKDVKIREKVMIGMESNKKFKIEEAERVRKLREAAAKK